MHRARLRLAALALVSFASASVSVACNALLKIEPPEIIAAHPNASPDATPASLDAGHDAAAADIDAGSDGSTSLCHRRHDRTAGDVDGDHRADILLVGGGPGWVATPVGSLVAGEITMRAYATYADFLDLATQPGAVALSGDFDNDGLADIALAGGVMATGASWRTIPVALGSRDGTFLRQANQDMPAFAWRANRSSKKLTGDFDGDGTWDIALLGEPGSTNIPIGNGTSGAFFATFVESQAFAARASADGVRAVAGDFDGDGKSDLALLAGGANPSLLFAFSEGNGSFRVEEKLLPALGPYADDASTLVVTGDFDSNGRDDIALAGGPTFPALALVLAGSDGTFTLNVSASSEIAKRAANPRATLLAGDFDGDGCADLAVVDAVVPDVLFPAAVPIAFSLGDGTFRVVATAGVGLQLAASENAQVLSASQAHH